MDVKGEQVKLHLKIDSKQAKGSAFWFPFAPPTGNVMYCIPKVGTTASLYFADDSGGSAKVTGCIRTNGEDCAKTGDPNNRYFGTEHGSEVELTPTAINVVSGSKEPLKISLDDATGITLTSHKKISLTATEDISLYTPKRIIIKAENLIVAKKLSKLSGFTIESEYHFLGDTVNKNGTDRPAYPKYDDEIETWTPPEPEPFSWGKVFSAIGKAVAVVGVVTLAAAFIVVTAGTGSVVAAIAVGAAIGVAGAVGATAARDIARGEESSWQEYIGSAAKGGLVGAITGGIFGPLGAIGASGTLLPQTVGQIARQYAMTSIFAGGASAYTDYVLNSLLDGTPYSFRDGLQTFLWGAALGPVIEKIGVPLAGWLKRGITTGFTKAGYQYYKLKDAASDLINQYQQKFSKDLKKAWESFRNMEVPNLGPQSANEVPIPNKTFGEVIDEYKFSQGKSGTSSGNGSSGGTGKDLLSPNGKFIDSKLESDYQKYLARKAKEGKPPRDRLEWKKARDYWLNDSPMARGNAFNKKSVVEEWYPCNEVHLSNGKRLDSYDPIKGEIVSRKATDLADIELSTFESYLKEMKVKYEPGTIIRTDKYADFKPPIDGQPLKGKQILEIPASNKNFSGIQDYIDLAKNKYGIEIRFREE